MFELEGCACRARCKSRCETAMDNYKRHNAASTRGRPLKTIGSHSLGEVLDLATAALFLAMLLSRVKEGYLPVNESAETLPASQLPVVPPCVPRVVPSTVMKDVDSSSYYVLPLQGGKSPHGNPGGE